MDIVNKAHRVVSGCKTVEQYDVAISWLMLAMRSVEPGSIKAALARITAEAQDSRSDILEDMDDFSWARQ